MTEDCLWIQVLLLTFLRQLTVHHHSGWPWWCITMMRLVTDAQILKFEFFIKKIPNKQKLYSYFTESSFNGAETSN